MVANNKRDLNSYCLMDWKVRNDEMDDVDVTMDGQVEITICIDVYSVIYDSTIVVINDIVIVADISIELIEAELKACKTVLNDNFIN